ncbi:nuclease-related domain-containing protein [Neobacillus dielmonensis]|uniref:nuclease-related domain-containing protein n=1 Tax=Neobacillus dielmonensis TaxID=1347369 RepID=UPI0029E7D15E|nr:nuclease-related domain-containing protein [Neobacillus dielmonensis]
MVLSPSDKQHYLNLKKGYEGEVMFDQRTEKLTCDCLILNDLLFKVNSTTFQIDSLIIFQGTIRFFEIKNFEGNFIYEDECFQTVGNKKIANPHHQLIRSDLLLHQLLQSHKIILPIEAQVVFVNPQCTLYECPCNKPFILPTQMDAYLAKLDNTPSKLSEKHSSIAEKLISLYIKKSPYTQLPSYKYEHLRKGNICPLCFSFSIKVVGSKLICLECGYEEKVENAVMRNVKEIMLLFPEMKITTNLVHEWCQVIDSKRRLSRILDKNMEIVGVGQWAYYENR